MTRLRARQTLSLLQLLTLVALLLLQFGIRAHNPQVKDPYVDEGFHLRRALRIYDLEEHPGRYSHGKVLLYFYLGLFDTDDPYTMLPTARLAMAIISLVTGAGLYALGRTLHTPSTGLIALALYAINPLAIFYERMAMADPLAALLMVLVVWRSVIFARRPTYRAGAVLGVLIALATLAKLTMTLLVLMPLTAALIYGRKQKHPRAFIRRYLPPLVLAGVAFCLVWSPFVIPAVLAHNSDDPFLLVNNYNIQRTDDDPESMAVYIQHITPMLEQFAYAGTVGTLSISVLIVLIIVWGLTIWQSPRHHLYLAVWFVLITILIVAISRLVSTRYFMPIAVPLSLLLALVITQMRQQWVRALLLLGVGVWSVVWVLPFVWTTITDPLDLPFTHINATEHTLGYLTGDVAFQEAAAFINQLESDERIIATWKVCHQIFFFVEREIACLPDGRPTSGLLTAIDALAPDETLLFVISGFRPYYDDIERIAYETLIITEHPRINRPVYVHRMRRAP